MWGYTKIAIILSVFGFLALVSGDEIVDRIQSMLSRLEARIAEDFDMLRAELDGITVKPPVSSEARVSDCSEWRRMGYTTSGVYTVYPDTMWRPLEVYCDMETDGGGWTVFQRRMDGSEDFYRNWMNYTAGFGNLTGEFWLGNEFVHRLTLNAPCELRIDMETFENEKAVAKYGLFSVGPRSGGYVLSVEYFTGNVTDSLIPAHHNQQFSTYDNGPSSTCSKSFKGGWWYTDCHSANLNGLYLEGEHESYADGVNWKLWKGYYYSLKTTEMKFRQL